MCLNPLSSDTFFFGVCVESLTTLTTRNDGQQKAIAFSALQWDQDFYCASCILLDNTAGLHTQHFQTIIRPFVRNMKSFEVEACYVKQKSFEFAACYVKQGFCLAKCKSLCKSPGSPALSLSFSPLPNRFSYQTHSDAHSDLKGSLHAYKHL